MKTLLFQDLPYASPLLFIATLVLYMHYRNPLLIVVGAVLFILLVFVYRLPARSPHGTTDRAILSPIDGTLLEIREHANTYTFVFYSSILDAQTQWAPYSGTIKSIDYGEGDRHLAWSLEDHDNNRQERIVIATSLGDMMLKKLHGIVTIQDRTFVDRGDTVAQKQELGYIIFPARIDLTIPKMNVDVVAHQNELVVGGETIIAKLK